MQNTETSEVKTVRPFHFHEDCTLGPWKLDETWMLVVGPNGEEVCAVHSGQPAEQRVNRLVAYDNAEAIAMVPDFLIERFNLKSENKRLRNALEITVASLTRVASTQAKAESIKGTLDVAREALGGGL